MTYQKIYLSHYRRCKAKGIKPMSLGSFYDYVYHPIMIPVFLQKSTATKRERVCAVLLHATAMANSLNRGSAIQVTKLALKSLRAGKLDLSVVAELEYRV